MSDNDKVLVGLAIVLLLIVANAFWPLIPAISLAFGVGMWVKS